MIVDKGEGRFEPREVKLGRRGDGYVEIRDGVAEGEPVVVSANFLIDAESNLKAALKGFARAEASHDRPPHRLVGAQPAAGADRHRLRRGGRPLCAAHLPLDAIPDLSDMQVIVYTEYPGQAPQVVEDQVTYPLTTAMLTVPKSKVVRGFSFFGVSFVYVIFEDGTDIYWARSRVLEYLNARGAAPAGRRDADARTGRDRRRLGLPVRGHGEGADPRRAALAPGLGRALRARQGGGRRRGRQRRRLRQAVQRRRRSAAAARPRHHAAEDARRDPRQQHATSAAAPSNSSEFEFMVRGRGYLKGIADIEQHRAEDRRRHAGAAARRRPRRARPRRAARHHRAQRRGRGRERHRAAALRRQCARRHRQRQEATRRDRQQPAESGRDRAGLRPLGADQRGDRDAASAR